MRSRNSVDVIVRPPDPLNAVEHIASTDFGRTAPTNPGRPGRSVDCRALQYGKAGVDCMTIQTFLSTTGGGITRSVQASGGAWAVDRPVVDGDVCCLAAGPLPANTVYAGTNGQGVLRSDDRGASWRLAGSGRPYRQNAGGEPNRAGRSVCRNQAAGIVGFARRRCKLDRAVLDPACAALVVVLRRPSGRIAPTCRVSLYRRRIRV